MTRLTNAGYPTSICLKYATYGQETGNALGIELWNTKPYQDVRENCKENNAVAPCDSGNYRFEGQCVPCKSGYDCPGGWDNNGWDPENKYYIDAMVKLCPQGHYCGIDGTVQQANVAWKNACPNKKCTIPGSFKKVLGSSPKNRRAPVLFPSVCCSEEKDRQIDNMCFGVTCPLECPDGKYFHASYGCKGKSYVQPSFNM